MRFENLFKRYVSQKSGLPALRPELIQSQKWLMIVRLLIVTIIIGIGFVFLRYPDYASYLKPFAVIVAIAYSLSGLYLLAFWLAVPFKWVLYAQMFLDILLVSATIHLTEGIESQFSLLYFLVILSAAIFLYMRGSLIVATFTAVTYSILVVMEFTNLLPSIHPASLPGQVSVTREYLLLKVYLHLCFFYLLAFVSGFVAERERVKEKSLEVTQEKLTRIRLDTDEILRHMTGGVISIDAHGFIVTFNKAAENILGYREDEIKGKQCEDVFKNDLPSFIEYLMDSMKSGRSITGYEMELERKGKSELPLRISTSILGEGENMLGLIAVFEDLTEERQLREQIQRADRLAAIGELSASIAHEIRNPLASISGAVQMLRDDLKVEGDNKSLLNLVIKESERLSRITGNFLDFARLKPGRMEVASIQQVIQDVIILVRNHDKMKASVQIISHVPPQALYVKMDDGQMRQMLLNLTLNALDAMDGCNPAQLGLHLSAVYSPAMNVSIARNRGKIPNGYAKITVADTGIGINPENKNKLFTPFFTTKKGGTGLGLAVVNRIIENHGGWIEVDSTPNKGTQFILYVPLALSSEIKISPPEQKAKG